MDRQEELSCCLRERRDQLTASVQAALAAKYPDVDPTLIHDSTTTALDQLKKTVERGSFRGDAGAFLEFAKTTATFQVIRGLRQKNTRKAAEARAAREKRHPLITAGLQLYWNVAAEVLARFDLPDGPRVDVAGLIQLFEPPGYLPAFLRVLDSLANKAHRELALMLIAGRSTSEIAQAKGVGASAVSMSKLRLAVDLERHAALRALLLRLARGESPPDPDDDPRPSASGPDAPSSHPISPPRHLGGGDGGGNGGNVEACRLGPPGNLFGDCGYRVVSHHRQKVVFSEGLIVSDWGIERSEPRATFEVEGSSVAKGASNTPTAPIGPVIPSARIPVEIRPTTRAGAGMPGRDPAPAMMPWTGPVHVATADAVAMMAATSPDAVSSSNPHAARPAVPTLARTAHDGPHRIAPGLTSPSARIKLTRSAPG